MQRVGALDLGFNPNLRLSFSAGLAQCHPSDELGTLLSKVDTALYAAKLNGRGRIEFGRPVASAARSGTAARAGRPVPAP